MSFMDIPKYLADVRQKYFLLETAGEFFPHLKFCSLYNLLIKMHLLKTRLYFFSLQKPQTQSGSY